MECVEEDCFAESIKIEERGARMIKIKTAIVTEDVMKVLRSKDLKRVSRNVVEFVVEAMEDVLPVVKEDRGKDGRR